MNASDLVAEIGFASRLGMYIGRMSMSPFCVANSWDMKQTWRSDVDDIM
jgi:hypothetical protein